MARNTPLARALQLLKGELGYALLPGTASAADSELYILIEERQKWLASEFDWPFLSEKAEVNLVAGTRFYTLPTTLNFERPVKVDCLFNSIWHCVDYGISVHNYNALASGDGVTAQAQDPVYAWRYQEGDDTMFEVWPVPASAQTLRFQGQRTLTNLRKTEEGMEFNFSTVATLDLDDTLVVLFAAAEKLARMEKADAKAKLALAEQRFARLRATSTSAPKTFVIGESTDQPKGVAYRRPRLN